ncbi:hypothetical protein E4U21_000136 [Claviceps maximensis]|nr:hypothetical protein E4U21_000136 [Claviceps maximensis]
MRATTIYSALFALFSVAAAAPLGAADVVQRAADNSDLPTFKPKKGSNEGPGIIPRAISAEAGKDLPVRATTPDCPHCF